MVKVLRRTAVTALLLPAVLVGCGTAPQEIPPVPAVGDARDVEGTDPCALLTANQLTAAGLGGIAAPSTAPEGPHCRWSSGGGDLDVTFYAGGEGLATLAANSEPTTARVRLGGYPALETFTGAGEFCQYDVGVSDRQVVMAALDAPSPDACVVLQRLVPQLLGSLPDAAR